MNRLIVVSNRVAVPAERKVATGGLATAIMAALRETGGIWFGWNGEVSESDSEASVFESGGLTYVTAPLTSQDYTEYYNGFANSTLWPLLHMRLDHMNFDRRSLQGYRRVNEKFADKLMRHVEPGDSIWIHDYHLIPMAAALRERGFDGAIGFFLHTPFPPCELLLALPCHDDIVRWLCAYDLVGFQTRRDLIAFNDYVGRESGGEIKDDEYVTAYGRHLRAVALPISVNPEEFAQMAGTASRSQTAERLKRSFGDQSIIIGVDRLDYSKGLVARFNAFEELLRRYPENRGRASMLQIAPLSRTEVTEYAELRRELEESSGRINGQFAEFDWVPIRYLTRSMQQRSLAVLFRGSAVGLVTPLRDGMNLVAKEYVAAQNPEDPGVLVLSRFAGAAEELPEALIVNPYDVEGVAEVLQRALTMPLEERQERWTAMYDTLSRNSLVRWRERFLELLREVDPRPAA